MGVRLSDRQNICWYCSTSGTAFGPVFSSHAEADAFSDWLLPVHGDPRDIHEDKLKHLHTQWHEQFWAAE